jgi:hypothetical protein
MKGVASRHSTKEAAMAVAYVQEFPIGERSTENYDFIADTIGTGPFDGLIIHSAGFDDEDGVFRIFDIWESKEQAQQFIEAHLQPLIDQGPQAFPNPDAFTQPTRDEFYELHNVIQQARTAAGEF